MINIDYTCDNLITPFAMRTLKERYMTDEETSPQEAYARAAQAFASDDAHAQRMYDYVSKNWMMFSTPILSNGGTTRGMPISCFLNTIPDSRNGIAEHYAENIWLASNGGGIGTYVGFLRTDGTATSGGSASNGAIPFLKVDDSLILAISQGKNRRGSSALYMQIDHPEIEEFIDIRKPTGGDPNRKALNLHHAVVLSDKFMQLIERCTQEPDTDDSFALIDPHSKKVVRTVSAKKLWQKILFNRVATGEPFIMYGDTVQALRPTELKVLGLDVWQSNLCTEIVLPTGRDYQDKERTAVCCLSSVNLEYYDEWKDSQMIEDLTVFLDNVLSWFIANAPKGMENAVYSARMERSIGIGAMGFHAFLQKNNIPFESAMATSWNNRIFKAIRTKAETMSIALGQEKGTAPDVANARTGAGRRNVHLLAIAPNASSGIIANTSPSVEPYIANAWKQKTLTGTDLCKNKYLDKLLMTKIGHVGIYDETWKSIRDNNGSVQHLDILTQDEKDVFKTAFELDQKWIVEHAATRQQYIDQAQSINLFMRGDVAIPYLHDIHMLAWKRGLKTLYYMKSQSTESVENTNTQTERIDLNECISCQG